MFQFSRKNLFELNVLQIVHNETFNYNFDVAHHGWATEKNIDFENTIVSFQTTFSINPKENSILKNTEKQDKQNNMHKSQENQDYFFNFSKKVKLTKLGSLGALEKASISWSKLCRLLRENF